QPPAAPAGPRLGMGPRGSGAKHRLGAPPPELLAVGVVDEPAPAAAAAAHAEDESNGGPPAPPGQRPRGGRGATQTAAQRVAAKTTGGIGRGRGKKGTSSPDE